jgi:hypothetical protein
MVPKASSSVMLLHFCYTAVTLLSHCCHTVRTLLLHWDYAVVYTVVYTVAAFLLNETKASSSSVPPL